MQPVRFALTIFFAWFVVSIPMGCGGQTDSRPPSKSGALRGGAPDVLLVVSPSVAAVGLRQPKQVQVQSLLSNGISMEATYGRFTTAPLNRDDFWHLGRGTAAPGLTELFTGGGYSIYEGTADEIRAAFLAERPKPGLFVIWLADPGWGALEEALSSLPPAKPNRQQLRAFTALIGDEQEPDLSEPRQRIPLVVQLPAEASLAGPAPGPADGSAAQLRSQVVHLADLGVTLLDLCGLWPEGQVSVDEEGSSFARILQKEPLVWRGFVVAEANNGDAWVRSARWRLLRRADGTELLSKVSEDPARTEDDSALPDATGQAQGLGLRLDSWSASR